jgi:hypothetical protein
MRVLLLLLSVPLFFFGCRKKNNNPDVTNQSGTFAYTVVYDSILQASANSVYYFPFNIKVLGGDIAKNMLTCTLDEVPAYVAANPASMVVGKLKSGVFTLSIGNLPKGDYPFKLKIFSALYGEQVSVVKLRIIPMTDFAPILAGVYDSCYDYCPDSGFYHYSSQVSTVADTPYLLKISNIRNLGTDLVVRAWVSKSVRIPVQTTGGKTIWGTGDYSQDARPGHGGHYMLAIKDTIVTGVDTQVCTMHIEH